MSGSKAEVVRIIDKRIEPQPSPVYSETIGPEQNQYYKIPASGYSNSSINFNNLTTLGANRAYLDTFEIELTVEMKFRYAVPDGTVIADAHAVWPKRGNWTFESFPLGKCTEEIRVNVNGGAFFSSPLSYLRAKERYWDDKELNEAYSNSYPCNKPWVQNEFAASMFQTAANPPVNNLRTALSSTTTSIPLRVGCYHGAFARTVSGPRGSTNNDILPVIPKKAIAVGNNEYTFTFSWREPLLASPFSSRIDKTYGRPLYNITSLDINLTLGNLGNMIRICDEYLSSYEINIKDARLCFQVLTIPLSFPCPPETVVPYRRYVPYITEYPNNGNGIARTFYTGDNGSNKFETTTQISMSSGVYTLNEVPTAIWVFLGPTKGELMNNQADGWVSGQSLDLQETRSVVNGAGEIKRPIFTEGIAAIGADRLQNSCWMYNKTFAHLKHINISCGNTTQILNTATELDLYRIAKANGCQDSYASWANETLYVNGVENMLVPGCGSVLRLIPGTDFTLPDQPLIPGANAKNMVFQVAQADFDIPAGVPDNYRKFALWILFEYVGVATIRPGECEITMNPLGDIVLPNETPIVSGSQNETVSTVEGSGWLDKIRSILGTLSHAAKQTKILSQAAEFIPGYGSTIAAGLRAMGYGQVGTKRPRTSSGAGIKGGAVMGYGDFM